MYLQNQWETKIAPILRQSIQSKEPHELIGVLVQTPDWKRDRSAALLQRHQGRINREIELISALEVLLPVGALPELAQAREVVRVWDNSPVRILPGHSGKGQETKLIGHSEYTGKGVVVALLDTGIAPHDDLTIPENRILAWHDLILDKNFPYDDHGHGTYMAGIIAGSGQSSRGRYKGLAPEAKLVGVKVLDRKGEGKLSDLLLGIEWCLNNQKALKIKVISLALGTAAQGHYYQDLLCRVTTFATKKGIVVCTAVGNGNEIRQEYNSPGINPRVIKVGLLDHQKVFTKENERLTNAGAKQRPDVIVCPDLVIPEINLMSLKTEGGYCLQPDYSPAVPLAAGGIALILQKWPYCKPAQVRRILTESADDLGVGAPLQGAGLMNLARILKQPPAALKPISNRKADHPDPKAKSNWTGGLLLQSGVGINSNQLLIKKLLTFILQNYDTFFPPTDQSASIDPSKQPTVNPVNLLIKTGLSLLTQEHPDPQQWWEELAESFHVALGRKSTTEKTKQS